MDGGDIDSRDEEKEPDEQHSKGHDEEDVPKLRDVELGPKCEEGDDGDDQGGGAGGEQDRLCREWHRNHRRHDRQSQGEQTEEDDVQRIPTLEVATGTNQAEISEDEKTVRHVEQPVAFRSAHAGLDKQLQSTHWRYYCSQVSNPCLT